MDILRLLAYALGVAGQQEIWLAQLLNDADFGGYAFGLMRMMPADHNGEICLADALADAGSPFIVEFTADRPVDDAEWGLGQFGLGNKIVA